MLFVVLLFFSVLFDLVLYLAGGKEKMKEEHLRNSKRRLSRKTFFRNEKLGHNTSSATEDKRGVGAGKLAGVDLEIALQQPLFKRPRSNDDNDDGVFENQARGASCVDDFQQLLTPEENKTSSSSAAASIRDYEFLKLIQQGGVGAVYLSRHRATGQKYAIKVLKKTTEKLTALARKEAATMLKLKNGSKHIAQLREVIENETNIFLVMQWGIGGDLFAYVENRKKVDEEDVWRIFAQVVDAVAFAHMQGIIHRDLKPGMLSFFFFFFFFFVVCILTFPFPKKTFFWTKTGVFYWGIGDIQAVGHLARKSANFGGQCTTVRPKCYGD